MTRRSVFADKLKEFAFVFGDDDIAKHRGEWRSFFNERKDNYPPLAGAREARPDPRVGGGGAEQSSNRVALSSTSPHPNPLPEGEGTGQVPRPDSSFNLKPSSLPSSLIPPPSSLLLEITCYNAEFLARIAAKHPAVNFIGLDWKARPLYLGAQKIAEQELTNLALLNARAQHLETIFAPGELDEIWLLHPDPFDNDRERAMRLMGESFLLKVHRLLRPGGRFVLKTDHREYFESANLDLNSTSLSDLFRVEQTSTDFWHDEAALHAAQSLCLAGETTLFERRFIKRRTPICFLSIIRM